MNGKQIVISGKHLEHLPDILRNFIETFDHSEVASDEPYVDAAKELLAAARAAVSTPLEPTEHLPGNWIVHPRENSYHRASEPCAHCAAARLA